MSATYTLDVIAEHAFKGLVLDQHLEQPMAGYLVGGYAVPRTVPIHMFVKWDVLKYLQENEHLFRGQGLFLSVERVNADEVELALVANMMFMSDAMIVGGMNGQSYIWDVLKGEEIRL